MNQPPNELERKPTITIEEFDNVVEECMDLPYEQMHPKLSRAVNKIASLWKMSEPFKKFIKLRREEILARIDDIPCSSRSRNLSDML